MKLSCVFCGKELIVEFGFKMEGCEGAGFIMDVKCKECGNMNQFRKILVKNKEDVSKIDEFISDVSKGLDTRYIG